MIDLNFSVIQVVPSQFLDLSPGYRALISGAPETVSAVYDSEQEAIGGLILELSEAGTITTIVKGVKK